MKFCKNMFFGPAGAHQLCDCKLVKLAEITPCSDWSESSLALIGADSFVIQKFCPSAEGNLFELCRTILFVPVSNLPSHSLI